MNRERLKKIFGVGPLGALISLVLLALTAGIDRYADVGDIAPRAAALRWVGGFLVILGLVLHGWSFMTLRAWWGRDQLCTKGPFRYLRHPMYAAWISLIAPGVVLIVNRWSYVIWLVVLHILWHRLVAREEDTMGRVFGDTYRRYAGRTGRFWPRLFGRFAD
ncbi:MAG: isoprenylcysteine carboxylmethyltransferase family protein [Desulfobacterales bacterium]|jgi:protein-S-isoprenylcysteine O-methyltransferase Ste14